MTSRRISSPLKGFTLKAKRLFKEETKGVVEVKVIPKGFMVKAAKGAKSNIPIKYGSPETSRLAALVKANSNSIPFDLTD